MTDFIRIAQFVASVSAHCGDAGSDPLQRLIDAVTSMFQVLSPDQLRAELVFALQIGDGCGSPFVDGAFEEVTNEQALHVLRGAPGEIALELSASGRIRYWVDPVALNLAGRLVYRYKGPGDELIHVADEQFAVPPLSGTLSRWAIPYFLDLEDALENYGEKSARFSQCPTLDSSWRPDGRRLIFAPRPEHLMRDSLVRALRTSLRGYRTLEVMPEQNVNATRPVDIKIRWGDNRQVAMIEIKWLGKSAREGGSSWTSQHHEGRGPEGLQQLADYLDLFRVESPDLDARGYLVVFDGRRDNLKVAGDPIAREDAYRFEHAALPYQAELLARHDMASPKRFFLEPAPEGIAS